MSSKIKRTFTQEFKKAVKLITELGYSIVEAASNLGISDSALGKWKRALENGGNPQAAFHGKGNARDTKLHASRKEVEKKAGVRYIKKGARVLCQAPRIKYLFIKENKGGYTAQELCNAMQVSVSSYYRGLKWPQSPRGQRDNFLRQLIIRLFNESKGRYGALRLQAALQKLAEHVGVKRFMQAKYLQAKGKRKYKATTDSRHNQCIAPNLMKQQFNSDKPNKV